MHGGPNFRTEHTLMNKHHDKFHIFRMKVKIKQDRVERIIKNIVEIMKEYNPDKIILFGSRARGDYKKNSDIDIAVDLELPFRERRKLKERIDELSGIYSVDLVFLAKTNEDFKNHILEEGVILYEKK